MAWGAGRGRAEAFTPYFQRALCLIVREGRTIRRNTGGGTSLENSEERNVMQMTLFEKIPAVRCCRVNMDQKVSRTLTLCHEEWRF